MFKVYLFDSLGDESDSFSSQLCGRILHSGIDVGQISRYRLSYNLTIEQLRSNDLTDFNDKFDRLID